MDREDSTFDFQRSMFEVSTSRFSRRIQEFTRIEQRMAQMDKRLVGRGAFIKSFFAVEHGLLYEEPAALTEFFWGRATDQSPLEGGCNPLFNRGILTFFE